MKEKQMSEVKEREWRGLLAIGKDGHKFLFDKEAQCMDAIDEERLVDLGRLIQGFGLGKWSNKKGLAAQTN